MQAVEAGNKIEATKGREAAKSNPQCTKSEARSLQGASKHQSNHQHGKHNQYHSYNMCWDSVDNQSPAIDCRDASASEHLCYGENEAGPKSAIWICSLGPVVLPQTTGGGKSNDASYGTLVLWKPDRCCQTDLVRRVTWLGRVVCRSRKQWNMRGRTHPSLTRAGWERWRPDVCMFQESLNRQVESETPQTHSKQDTSLVQISAGVNRIQNNKNTLS